MNRFFFAAFIIAACFLCGCQFSAGTSSDSPSLNLADLVIPKRPMAFSNGCNQPCTVVCPDGWGSCCPDPVPEATVAVPARLFDNTQIRERTLPSIEPTTRIPTRLIEGATIVTENGESVPVPVRIRVETTTEPTDGN